MTVRTTFAWPLVPAGATKLVHDLLLLARCRGVPAEVGAPRGRRGARV